MTRGLFDEREPSDDRDLTSPWFAQEHSTAASLALNVGPSRQAPRVVRHTLAGWLGALGGPADFIDDMALVVSELATDAVTHADSTVQVRAEVADGRLRLEVRNDSSRRPASRGADELTGGYGLAFVAALTDDWGWSTTPAANGVWIERRFADPTIHEGRGMP